MDNVAFPKHLEFLTGPLPTVGFRLAVVVVASPVDSLGTLVNMCKCAGRASILCMRGTYQTYIVYRDHAMTK